MKKIVMLLAVVSLMSSCVKAPTENPDPVIPVTDILLKKTIVITALDGTITTEYTYEGKKIQSTLDSSGSRTEYTYNDQGLLSKMEVFDESSSIPDAVQETHDLIYDGVTTDLIQYTYVDLVMNKGTKISYLHDPITGEISYSEFLGDALNQEIPGDTGVISSSSFSEIVEDDVTLETITYKSIFTFDDKNFPLMNVIGLEKSYFADSGEPLNFEHNVLTESEKVDDAAAELRYVRTYTYNSNNFPILETEKDENGVLISSTKYIYF